jgi:RNA polymerase-binding transcription factor DksA
VYDPASEGLDGASLDALQGEVDDIERALARLDEGSYGTCEVCGGALPAAVLAERPAARFCPAHLPVSYS